MSSAKLVIPEFLSTAKTGKKLVERRLTISRKNSWSNATMHRSVYERFDMDEVPDYDAMTEYRPITLSNHRDFEDAYGKPGSKLTRNEGPWRRTSKSGFRQISKFLFRRRGASK